MGEKVERDVMGWYSKKNKAAYIGSLLTTEHNFLCVAILLAQG